MVDKQEWVKLLPDAALEWLGGRRVEEVECIVPDLVGISRGKTMPAKKFSSDAFFYLPTSIFYQTITGAYADMDIKDQWMETDMVLKPDLSTACAAPWTDDVILQVIHDLETTQGEPVPVAPRNVLKRVLSLYADKGWRPVVAPEIEFYLTRPHTDPNEAIEPPIGRTGRKGIGRQAYSMVAVDEYGEVIDDIYDFAEAQGLEIDTLIQEGGAGQIEINLQHGDPLKLADEVFYFKRSIREAALKNNCFATFMAKPMRDEPGSAMHLHQSIVDVKTGKNIFSDDQGEPTPYFYGFLGGLQTHIDAVMPIFAPYVNSYRRFKADDSAAANVEWGQDNRTTGLRIPISTPEARRIENRIVGMDSNPYLAIAASLACGYLGMINQLTPRPMRKGDAYEDGVTLPYALMDALEAFQEDRDLRDLLGEDFCLVYEAIKRQELEEFLGEISPWEREHLLLNV
ncbi:glutamine synthetase family protein [Maritalea sp. S77]|uniref:glutamine synthetase family protein n=1 Tax=Maritalea sp. S77 TaxID=3415125 RepID=UPI003C7E0749